MKLRNFREMCNQIIIAGDIANLKLYSILQYISDIKENILKVEAIDSLINKLGTIKLLKNLFLFYVGSSTLMILLNYIIMLSFIFLYLFFRYISYIISKLV